MTQPQPMEALAAAGAANVDAMRSLAFSSLKATERLVGLNLDFARVSLRLGADYARPASNVDWRHLFAQQSNGLQKSAEEAATYLRGVYDIATEAQVEMNDVISTQVDELSGSMTALLDAIAKSAPGSDKAVGLLRSAFANSCTTYAQMMKGAPPAGGNGSATRKAAKKGQ